MVARIHHCIGDGIALGRVLLSLTDETPDAGIAPTEEVASPGRGGGPLGALVRPAASVVGAVRGAAGAVAHEAIEVGRHPSHLADLAATGRADADALAKLLLKGADERTALKGELGVAQSVAWSAPIPLDQVKAVGHATGTTVNDVVLAAVAGALGRYLRVRGSPVDELTAIVPFNLRPLDQPLPPDLGNRFGLVFLQLPVGLEDRERRLDEVHRRMEEIKHSPEGAISYGVLDAIGRTPVQIEKLLVDLFAAKGTRGDDQRAGAAQPGLPRRHARTRRPGLGPLLGGRLDERLDLQLLGRDHRRPDGGRGADSRSRGDRHRIRARDRGRLPQLSLTTA